MASRVTAEDILNFNRLYYKYKTYTAVARETGFSASTVSKYVDKNWKPIDETRRKIFNPSDLPDQINAESFLATNNFGDLCVLSEDEQNEIKELWDEMEV